VGAFPAARVTDPQVCACPTPNPHGGGPILPPCSLNVVTNALPQARATDQAVCPGPPNFIVTGSSSVMVDGLMAARMTDKMMHPPPGMIVLGSTNVIIGGPTAGATLGNLAGATAGCTAAASSRTSGNVSQSYNNCGVESSRQIVNQATGAGIGEDALLDQSTKNGDADTARHRSDSGGTSPAQRRDILATNGVPSTLQDPTTQNIAQAVAERKGVITSHDVSVFWPPPGQAGTPQTGGHAVVVTAVGYDANGNLATVTVNDTGWGICGSTYPAARFQSSLRPGRQMNVTTNPVW
jgi:uncharacterized Zn-binding protein involved in type VI secretion